MAIPLPMLVPTAEHPNMGFPIWQLGAWNTTEPLDISGLVNRVWDGILLSRY